MQHPEDVPAFWQALSPANRADLAKLGILRRYRADTIIIRQNELSDHVLVLRHGCVKVTSYTEQGYEAVLGLRDVDDLVGELAGIDGGPRSATLCALTDVVALSVEAAEFGSFQRSRPEVDLAVQRTLTGRLREADRIRAEVGADRVARRLALLLVRLAQRYGRRRDDGTVVIELPLTQDDLAGLVLASKRTVARVLEQWRNDGLLDTGRRRVELKDLAALSRLGA